MKKISLQSRLALMTGLLLAISCLSMQVLTNRTAYFYIDSLGGFVQDIDQEDKLYINIPQEDLEDFVQDFSKQVTTSKVNFSRETWLITGLVSLTGSLVAYFLSGLALKPLRDFSQEIAQVQVKNIPRPRPTQGLAKEFQDLNQSFNQMLDHLAKSFASQRKFTSRAAHELRTPLAVIQAQLDLYQEGPMGQDQSRDLVQGLRLEVDKLDKLVTSLLDLSDLGSLPRTDQLNLVPLIEEVLQDLDPFLDQRGLKVDKDLEDFSILANDTLIYRAIFNLVDNAIKYNQDQGLIRISTKIDQGWGRLTIENTGQTIDKEDRQDIFKAFYRGQDLANKAPGRGLGLALVYETIQVHGGHIQVEDGDLATKITLRLPLIHS